jgi:hypothetical protein
VARSRTFFRYFTWQSHPGRGWDPPARQHHRARTGKRKDADTCARYLTAKAPFRAVRDFLATLTCAPAATSHAPGLPEDSTKSNTYVLGTAESA